MEGKEVPTPELSRSKIMKRDNMMGWFPTDEGEIIRRVETPEPEGHPCLLKGTLRFSMVKRSRELSVDIRLLNRKTPMKTLEDVPSSPEHNSDGAEEQQDMDAAVDAEL
ncbi:hypothetical protein R1sor_016291 [Riccia sorocarpa]|uniref:Uncharacterized protein n=1 Tax=Riccia sorocarpa TaxID=122646 RepID=A0ABD3HHT6_9MARC